VKRKLTGFALLALLALMVLPTSALAAFGFEDLDVTFTDENAAITTQAGSHPFAMTTTFKVNTFVNGEGKEVPEGETKDLTLSQIEGLAGNPTATPRCPAANFIELSESGPRCPTATAVGIAAIRGDFAPISAADEGALHLPVYNLEPPPGVAAQLGFNVLGEPVTVQLTVSDEYPHNIVASIESIPQVLFFYSSEVTIWGNPADEAHDPLRGKCVGEAAIPTEEPVSKGLCPVDVPDEPFLTLPRACLGPLQTTLQATSWEGEDAEDSVLTHDEATPPNPQGITGCESLEFQPQTQAQATTAAAESPSGLDFSIQVDDEGLTSVDGRANADIRKVEVTLPEGVTANPSAANGLGACTKAQYESASVASAGCPDASKLGTVDVQTPILENTTLHGEVFLAEQDNPSTTTPGAENPFDSLLAMYMVIRDPTLGIVVTQAAKVQPDPQTGQIVTTVEDLPQFPLSEVELHLHGGPRAPLVAPPTCGSHAIKALLTSWTGKTVESSSSFTTTFGPNGSPCPSGAPGFNPGFEAGSINNAAGAFSPFYMRLTRNDGEQDMTRLSSVLPPGVTGKIAGVAKCPDLAIAAAAVKTGRAELASPSCPGSSQIGRVMVGAGVGSSLTYVPGRMYLAGPFAGHPLSIAVITPAVAGPFDVGTVVTRVALDLNPETAQVEVDGSASDPFPRILQGIPLKLRELEIYVDREGFTLNPTSCNPMQVQASLLGSSTAAQLTDRYQAASCSALGFAPKISLRLKGGTRRSAHPALRAEVKARAGDANIGAVTAVLPRSAFLDQGHIRTVCTRVQFNANACPAGSVYGYARAFTPLLDEPLEGSVYLRSNGGERELPDLVAALKGTVDFNLVGFIDSVDSRLRSRFVSAPDVPVTKFVLSMQGGAKGLIVNSENLCAKKQRARIRFTGHNGKVLKVQPLVKNGCKGKKRSGRY